mgnify:CR=1 FL=1
MQQKENTVPIIEPVARELLLAELTPARKMRNTHRAGNEIYIFSAAECPSLMREVGYEFAYMFKYSERPGTFASKHLPDDVPDEVKTRRLSEIIALQNELSEASNRRDVGREFEVLVEGTSKRDENQLSGRTSQNKVVVFDRGGHGVGEYVRVRITGCSSATLFGEEIK